MAVAHTCGDDCVCTVLGQVSPRDVGDKSQSPSQSPAPCEAGEDSHMCTPKDLMNEREGNCTPGDCDGFGEVVPWTGLSTLNRELAFKPPSRCGCGFYCCGLGFFWFFNSLWIPQTYVAAWLAI